MPDPIDPQVLANREQLVNRLIDARRQGASWDQIHQSIANRVQMARSQGATDAQIEHSLGFTNPEELIEATQQKAQQELQAQKPTSWTEALVNGWTHSSLAAVLGVKPSQAPVEGHWHQLASGFAEAVGDVPANIIGGIFGAGAGAAAGGAVGAAVPGAGETGTSEAGGAAVGTAMGAGAGAMALPQLIKSERDRYVSALNSGQVKGPEDFLNIQGQVLKDTGEQAGVGGITAGVGSKVAPLIEKIGGGRITKFLATVGTEAATMATAQSAIAGHMPRLEDFVDAAVTVGAFHVALKATPEGYKAIRQRVMNEYVENGTHPDDVARQAINDPVYRAKMLGIPDPKVPPGSSKTHVAAMEMDKPGVLKGPRFVPDQYIIPRAAGDFDHAVQWILKEEGGLTTDTGGVTKYGISQKAHPGVDIAHLSQEDAAEIYHKEYWRAIDADSLPPNMRLAAFDSAVNQGVGQTKTWLKEAGGDLQKFMQLRIQKYAQLARDPKYAKYADAWAKRIKDLGGSDAMASIVARGPDNVGREFSPEDMAALDMDGGKPPEPPETGRGEPPEDEDPWKHVMGRVAPDEGVNWLGDTIEGFKRVYGELFDPDHPIRKLVDGVTKGDPLDDYRNPELLRRVAENSGEVVKSAISRGMVDLDGNTVGPSLEDIVSGKSVGQKFSPEEIRKFLNGYSIAKWAVMMDEQGKASGVDIEKAKAVIADGQDKYGDAFQHLVDWRNGTLKWLGDGGIHAKDKVQKLIDENQSTIPGYRRMDDGSYKPVSTGKPGIWNPIKTAKGSERQVEPILKSLIQDAFLRHELAANNRAMVALADLGIQGNKATEKRAVNINIVSALDDLKEQGIDEDILSGLAKSAGAVLPKDQVPIFRDGKMYGVKFEDPDLTRLLRGYDQTAQGTIMKVIGAVTSVPRNLQTRFNPLFPVRLLTYDLPWQFIVNPDSKGPLSNFFLGLGHMTSDPEGYQKWMQSGGADRVFDSLSKDAYMRKVLSGTEEPSLASNMWNVVKTPFDALTAWSRMVSTPLRFGRYVKGQQKGETPLRAAVASSEAAFHRPGYGGPIGKAWNTIVPYTTAHLNGLEKSVRALFGIGRTVTGEDYSAARTWARGIALITAPVVAQWFANKDEEWYKAMPDWQKNNAWFIVPPSGNRPPIPVAAPPILSAIFVALPRMLLEKYVADNPHAGDHWESTFGASLLPPGGLTSASILTPIVEHIANFSFHRDRPLVSQDTVNGVQPAEQFTQYTSPAAKDLAQFASDLPLVHLNVAPSPAVIDNYIAQWGGPIGRAAVNAADAAIARTPDTPRPEGKVEDWPGISSWVVRYPSASAAPIEQFYDTVTQLNQEHGSLVKEMREGNFAAFKRIVDQGGPTAAAYHQINLGSNVPQGVDLSPYLDYLTRVASGADYGNLTLVKQAADAMKNAHDYSQSVYENRNLSPHDKRQILDMINAQMQVISERGNEALDRARIGVKNPGRSARAPIPDSIQFNPPEMAQ